MLMMSTSPTLAYPALSAPFLGIWSDVADLYRGAMRSNTEQLLLSSTRIVQEQMLRAFITTSQSCADALAKNALAVQQQSMERLAEANGKAVGLIGQALTQAWMKGLQPTT